MGLTFKKNDQLEKMLEDFADIPEDFKAKKKAKKNDKNDKTTDKKDK